MPYRVALSSAAYVVRRYLQIVARSASFTIALDTGPSIEVLPANNNIEATLTRLFSAAPTIFPLWNAHSLLLLAFYLGSMNLWKQMPHFQAVADDSPGGLLTGHLLRHAGIPWRKISYASPARRLEDLKQLIQDRPNLIMAADSHGPYRAVRPGLARLVRSYEGLARPLSLHCSRSIPLFRGIGMALPLPHSSISAVIGRSPKVAVGDLSLGQVRDHLEQSLRDLEARAEALTLHGS